MERFSSYYHIGIVRSSRRCTHFVFKVRTLLLRTHEATVVTLQIVWVSVFTCLDKWGSWKWVLMLKCICKARWIIILTSSQICLKFLLNRLLFEVKSLLWLLIWIAFLQILVTGHSRYRLSWNIESRVYLLIHCLKLIKSSLKVGVIYWWLTLFEGLDAWLDNSFGNHRSEGEVT